MSDNTNTETKTEAKKQPAREIIRGRAPAPIVFAIRFGNLAEGPNELAKMFGTTVGKVYDIQKNRNFAYITEDVMFSDEMIAEAEEWINRHPNFEEDGAADVVAYLQNMPRGSEEEVAKFQEAKSAARGQNTKTKSGDDADAGGGNRRKKAKKEEAADEAGEAAADAVADPAAEDLLG